MQINKFYLSAELEFNEFSIENFLSICETAVMQISEKENVRYFLKNALNELVVNCIEHGYQKESGNVSISIKRINQNIVFQISDYGTGMNDSIDINHIAISHDHLTSRGWGLSILNKLSNEMRIENNTPKGTRIILTISD